MAVAIMLIEAGMLSGVLDAQANLANLARADLIIMSRLRTNLHDWTRMRMAWLIDAAGMAGVTRVTPVYQSTMLLRSVNYSGRPRSTEERTTRDIIVLAFAPDKIPFDFGADDRVVAALKRPGSVAFDRHSRPIYGDIAVNRDVELDLHPWHVGGLVDIGPDIVNDGAVVMSAANWQRVEPDQPPIMGMVYLVPGAALDVVQRRIAAELPKEVMVLTPAELRFQDYDFTLRVAPIGVVFGVGMLAGLVIGTITCYQVLFNAVNDHLATYTTLKAMGFSTGFLYRVMLEQAVLLALCGTAAGVVLAAGLDAWLGRAIGFGIQLGLLPTLLIVLPAMAVVSGAGMLAVRRVVRADPAALL